MPKPPRMLRIPPEKARLSAVRLSVHAVMRSEERCGLTADELDLALTEWSVPLRATSRGDRTWHLFFVPQAANFFVGIVAPTASLPAVVTVLAKQQYEDSFGQLPADALRAAAYRALSAGDFDHWASSFNWADQRMPRGELRVRARYRLEDGRLCVLEVPITSASDEAPSGGKLSQLMVDNGFLNRVIADLYSHLGEDAPVALSRLSSMEITYCSQPILDMLAVGGADLLLRLKTRPVRRQDITLFGTFVHGLRLEQFQKTAPRIPPEFAFLDRIPDLCQSDEFLGVVRDAIAKRVPPEDLVQALATVSDLHVELDGRRIDLNPPDEHDTVQRLKALA